MAAKAFLEQYIDCMDSLPLDIQRIISQYWELDNRIADLMAEARDVRDTGAKLATDNPYTTTRERMNWLYRLQQINLSLREVGNEKLELTSQILDVVEGYTQQLMLAEKEVDSCRTRDELTGTRGNVSNMYKNSSSATSADFNEKKKGERHNKRPRTVVQDSHEDEFLPSNASLTKDSTSNKESTVSASPTIKPPKRGKEKLKKKGSVSNKEILASNDIPKPDFNSEPIDPDEPTYCLCDQVSFGEMIGCDNEDCPIEWFHFVCVGLTSKPKGKWYCPQCSKQRTKHRSSK